MSKFTLLLVVCLIATTYAHQNGFVQKTERKYEELLSADLGLPQAFTWGDVDGVSYITKSWNQHIPQYCGSCWCWGASSALSDRIKIARKAAAPDYMVSVQAILNNGDAGSCYGGDHLSVYEWIHKAGGVPYDSCQPYIACSSDSSEGFCGHVNTESSAFNTCRTCPTFGEPCVAIDKYPNVTVSSYKSVRGADNMKQEIYQNGPIACGVNAVAILSYDGSVLDVPNEDKGIDHIISIVGWGHDESSGKQYWIVRNSWGEYWGDMGYFYVVLGENQLGLESDCAAATIGTFSEHNFPCDEGGANCTGGSIFA